MRFATLLLTAGFVLTCTGVRADDPKPQPEKSLDFAGRVEAATVEVRPRVAGYLVKILVKQGEAVKQGDLIAEIDPRQLRIELDLARAKVSVAMAGLKLAATNHERARASFARGAASKEEVTQTEAEHTRAEALVTTAKAELALAELNLSWTKLTTPMDGRVGRFHVTEGTLLSADGPAVVAVVAVDPLFVAFDVDERTILKMRRDGLADVGKLAASVGLVDEDGFPHKAVIDFIDPQFDPKTSTVRVRGVIANPKGLISPGMFVRVRLTLPVK